MSPADLQGMSTEQLCELQRQLKDTLKARWEAANKERNPGFNIGDEVWFDTGSRGRVVGTILNINWYTTGVGISGSLSRWNVAPRNLNKGKP